MLIRKQVDRIVAVAMIIAWLIAVTHDAFMTNSEAYFSLSDLSYGVATARHPITVFVSINILAGLAVLAGAVMAFFRRPNSATVLLVGAALTFISFATFDVVVYTDVSAAATFVFSVLLGWLIAGSGLGSAGSLGQ